MKGEQRHGVWKAAAQLLLGSIGLALLTFVCFLFSCQYHDGRPSLSDCRRPSVP